ncbi:MAG: anhydro-N-acetylmuramic acid kinase [Panacagrimonas sp.]
MRERFAGVMSGTSQDGIDAVLAEFDDGRFAGITAHHAGHYDASLRAELIDLSREATPVHLARWAELDRQVADAFADTLLALLDQAGVPAHEIRAVGTHGQTVFHDPVRAQSSLQLGDPSRIAVRTGIAVVADFRRADVALGGQGAPLLPAFHHALFAKAAEPRAVLNVGGISNLSLLPGLDPGSVRGWDCGPASCLMDEWAERHLGTSFDDRGAWAAGGSLIPGLLDALLADAYFGLPPPKSTGRGRFNIAWVAERAPDLVRWPPRDVQRTLCELTARTVADGLLRKSGGTQRVLVCGGGWRNEFLIASLRACLPGITIQSTAEHGLDPQMVEAAAFAWLACRRLRREPGNLPSVTGARRPAVLGGLYEP